MSDYELTNLASKAFSPTDQILTDDKGLPSVMVRIPKFLISDVIAGGSATTHPAFIVNGQEVDAIYISKYQNVLHDGHAYSLPLEDPHTGINFDAAVVASAAKGVGWHLMTRAEWAAIALWCRHNCLMPKGNNNNGKDYTDSMQEAIPATYDGAAVNRVFTGSGPLTWSHNGEQSGIFDLNGNVNEWLGGYRTVNGEIQVLESNNAADADNSQLAASAAWKAILEDGTLVAPGTADTLKWDYVALPTGGGSAVFKLSNTIANQQAAEGDGYGSAQFEALTAETGVTVPELLKALALFPADAGNHGTDNFYMRNIGERLGCAGGDCENGEAGGIFSQNSIELRTKEDAGIGFRCAYAELPT